MHPSFVKALFIQSAVALLVLTMGAAEARAQVSTQNAPAEIGVGLKSGVQWPTSDGGADHLESSIGVFVDYNGRGHIGVTGDVLFVMTPESDEPGAPRGKFDYFQLPVMVRVHQGNGTFGVYGIAGPAFNVKISGSDEFQDETVDFVAGGGVEIKNAMIEARISRGSRDCVISGITSSFTQQTFALLVAFRLRP